MGTNSAGNSKVVKKTVQLQFDEAVNQKRYDLADDILSTYPELNFIPDINKDLFLVRAIRLWDLQLVVLAMKHGGDPESVHVCDKDHKRKNAFLVATEVLLDEVSEIKGGFERNYLIYQHILSAMGVCAPFKMGR